MIRLWARLGLGHQSEMRVRGLFSSAWLSLWDLLDLEGLMWLRHSFKGAQGDLGPLVLLGGGQGQFLWGMLIIREVWDRGTWNFLYFLLSFAVDLKLF